MKNFSYSQKQYNTGQVIAMSKFFSTSDRLLTQGDFWLVFYTIEKCSALLTCSWRNIFTANTVHRNRSTNILVEDFMVRIDTATTMGKLVLFSQQTWLIQKPEITDVEISYQHKTSTWPRQLSQQHLKHHNIKPGWWDNNNNLYYLYSANIWDERGRLLQLNALSDCFEVATVEWVDIIGQGYIACGVNPVTPPPFPTHPCIRLQFCWWA